MPVIMQLSKSEQATFSSDELHARFTRSWVSSWRKYRRMEEALAKDSSLEVLEGASIAGVSALSVGGDKYGVNRNEDGWVWCRCFFEDFERGSFERRECGLAVVIHVVPQEERMQTTEGM